jgi:hypothetical protein
MTAPGEMFLPGSRHEWTSLVRPPIGYRLDAALGTTYCLNFTALTALLIASLDQQSARPSWDNRPQMLQMITRLGDRVRVLVNRGQIHADIRPENKVFTLFDRIVGEVRHDNGSFHPKVWVLKYSPRQPVDPEARVSGGPKTASRASIYRLLCTSRNLTLTSTWEAVICLDGRIVSAEQGYSLEMGRQVAAFFEKSTAVGDPLSSPLQLLLKDLKQVAFSTEGSKAVQWCQFVWQWPGMPGIAKGLDTEGKTALLVSPFISSDFLKWLAKAFKKVIVVGRQEELDCLWGDHLARLIPLKHFWVVKSSEGDGDAEGVASLDLHAKLLVCEYPKRTGATSRTEAWLGSSNASSRAWGLTPRGPMNCEAMIQFRPAMRPEQFLTQFAYRKEAASALEGPVLNGWIEQYQPRPVDEVTEEDASDQLLDSVVEDIGGCQLTARFERADERVILALEAPRKQEWEKLLGDHPGINFEVCPLGLAEERPFQNLTTIVTAAINFDGLSMAQVGAFMLIRLTDAATGRQKQFAVKAETEMAGDFWDDRREAFLQKHLDAKDFRQFLRFILFGEALSREHGVDLDGDGDDSPDDARKLRQGPTPSLFDDFTVEDILHSCTEDRSRIDEIDRLLAAVGATVHVDPSFRMFWTNFRQAVRSAEEHRPQ